MRNPDVNGRAKAWHIPINKKRPDWAPDWDATISSYLLHCAWSHPMWSWYDLHIVHLRDIPGVPPAKKHYPEAEYELMIQSLDPKFQHDPDKLYSGEQQLHFLTPADLVFHFHGINDKQAARLLHEIIITICDGQAAPDVDYRPWWQQYIPKLIEKIKKEKVQ